MKSWVENYIQGPPKDLTVERVAVEGGATCPECGSADVRRYPIGCAWGARMATKCQDCLHTLALERPSADDSWPPFRPLTFDWEPSPSERATRTELERGER